MTSFNDFEIACFLHAFLLPIPSSEVFVQQSSIQMFFALFMLCRYPIEHKIAIYFAGLLFYKIISFLELLYFNEVLKESSIFIIRVTRL